MALAGQPTTLTANQLTRTDAKALLAFAGYGQDLGTANNRLFFYTPLTPQLANGILPWATLGKSGDIDFASYDLVRGLFAATSLASLAAASSAPAIPALCQMGFEASSLAGRIPVRITGTVPIRTRRVSLGERLSTPGSMEVTRAWQVMSAIHSYIATHKDKDDHLDIKDDKTGETLPLDFVEIHQPVRHLKSNGQYFVCTDFRKPGSQSRACLAATTAA